MNSMNRSLFRLFPVFALLALSLVLCACDSRRNQIISNLIASPTVTFTPEPPTATPTAIPTKTPFPTPTTSPIQSMEELRIGDFDMAHKAIDERIESSEEVPETLKAEADRIELNYAQGQYTACIRHANALSEYAENPSDEEKSVLSKAYYIAGQCASEEARYKTEIDFLTNYLTFRGDSPIAAGVYSQIAYAYQNLGDHELFRQNIDKMKELDPSMAGDYTQLDYALSYADTDKERESELLLALYETSTDDNIRAAAAYYLGNICEAQGLREQAISRYREVVNNYPRSYYSYLALLWLLDNNQTVSDFQRGLINYYVGQYSLANDAFRRYIKSEPGHDGSSWYYIGICNENLADYDEAITALQKLIDNYPENKFYVSAWDEIAYIQWAHQSRHKIAAETLLDYVKQHPDQPDSASFIFEAGKILERGNYLSDAAKQWSRLIDEYPLYEQSRSALFSAAIAYYRITDYESALSLLNRLLIVSNIPDDQAQANLWIAKIYEKKGDTYNYRKYLEKAASQSKTGYYSLRAAELLEGKDFMTPPSSFSFEVDFEGEKQIADQWLMLTFSLTSNALTDGSTYMIMDDYKQGVEYYALGQYQQAVLRFDNVRESLIGLPAQEYAFLNEMYEKGLYRECALISRQILSDAGLHEDDRTMEVPNYFNHMRFGPWYRYYVEQSASMYNISPAILYAVMKQESMYNPWSGSSAGALGLMQIMPETGAEINKSLHWPEDYTDDDLYRVPVAVNYGASYLSRMNSYFDGSNIAMISAYNGGSGNTLKWKAAAGNDPDLLYEVIRFSETRNYIHNVYVNDKIYEWLYADTL